MNATVLDSIALLAAGALLFLFYALFWLARHRRAGRQSHLLRRMVGGSLAEAEGAVDGAAGPLLIRWLERRHTVRWLDYALQQAGVVRPAAQVLLYCVFGLLVLLVLLVLTTGSVIGALLLDGLAAVLLLGYLQNRRLGRARLIEQQLPETLELMVLNLRAGYPFEEALRAVAQETAPPIEEELSRCIREYDLGRPIDKALTSLAVRVQPGTALATWVEAVLILRQTGGNLIEVMERIIHTLRDHTAFEQRFRALTAEGRTSGRVLAGLPLVVVAAVLLLNPGYVRGLLADGSGRLILMLSIGLWMSGVLWLTQLSRPST